MTSIELGKLCRPYNIQYREMFGYVPCREDYLCTQEEYYTALQTAVMKKVELQELIKKRKNEPYSEYDKLY